MKKYFKKSVAVFMAMLMLLSVLGVSAMAATYKVEYLPGRYCSETGPAAVMVEGGTTITLLGKTFNREGYVQAGWSTAAAGTRKNYDLGASLKITKNTKLYPYWEAIQYVVTFAPGEYGVGTVKTDEVNEGKTTKFPGAIYSRDGYIQIGWSSVDGGALEYGLTDTTPAITADIAFYPVWEKCVYTVEVDATNFYFGSVCEEYATPAAQFVTIENTGNATIQYTLPTVAGYNIKVVSGSLNLAAGATLKISVQPEANLTVNDYSGAFILDADHDEADVTINVAFIVNEHSYDKYYSNNDATYEADGTKSAECSNGCGRVDIVIDEGSMKIYSANNNTAEGLLKEYIYHKTVRFTAYGSGMDNIQPDGSIAEGTLRFLPVSWYVSDEFNGEFNGENFDVNFVHTSFGDYTLKIKFVEQRYEDGEWVETGVEDEKTFDYYVGPSAKEEQEVVRPNMIVNILFALFAYIGDLFGSFFG